MVDLKSQFLEIREEVLSGIEQVCTDANFIQGAPVRGFAAELAKYTGSKYIIPCANGTDALQIAFMALGLQPGDEVIVPTWTYVATAEVIALLGLKPRFIDVDSDHFCIHPEQLEKVYTPRTKAIVPVHLYGQCAPMDEIMAFAQKYNLYVIEDTAQAIGSVYTSASGAKKQAGTIGHIGTTSFFPSKNLGCYGDGGAIYVQDEALAKRIQAICDHGQLNQKYYHDIVGVNSRLDSIQAVVLSAKLKKLDDYAAKRARLAAKYSAGFSDLKALKTPHVSSYSSHVYHQYTLRILDGSRDALKAYLESKDIPAMIYYPLPLHHQLAYAHYLRGDEDLKVSEMLSGQVISLPMHTEMEEDQSDYIIQAVKSFYHE